MYILNFGGTSKREYTRAQARASHIHKKKQALILVHAQTRYSTSTYKWATP